MSSLEQKKLVENFLNQESFRIDGSILEALFRLARMHSNLFRLADDHIREGLNKEIVEQESRISEFLLPSGLRILRYGLVLIAGMKKKVNDDPIVMFGYMDDTLKGHYPLGAEPRSDLEDFLAALKGWEDFSFASGYEITLENLKNDEWIRFMGFDSMNVPLSEKGLNKIRKSRKPEFHIVGVL